MKFSLVRTLVATVGSNNVLSSAGLHAQQSINYQTTHEVLSEVTAAAALFKLCCTLAFCKIIGSHAFDPKANPASTPYGSSERATP
jgi:hypothetical protein